MNRLSHVQATAPWWRRALDGLEFGLIALFYALIWPLPNRIASGLMAPAGGLVARFVPVFRWRAEANIAHVWPHLDRAARLRLVRKAGAEFACLGVEYIRFERLCPDCAEVVAGHEVMEAVRASGRGAVVVSAHYGHWEGVRLAARSLGVELGIIYRTFNNRYFEAYIRSLIRRGGEPVLQKSRSGNRALVTHVLRGGAMLILADQRNTGAPMIPFLGQPCETSTAAAEIALRAKVPLITAHARRVSRAPRYEVRFEAPVPEGPPMEMMTEVNRRIGAWVEECPEQWFWFHRRWGKGVARG